MLFFYFADAILNVFLGCKITEITWRRTWHCTTLQRQKVKILSFIFWNLVILITTLFQNLHSNNWSKKSWINNSIKHKNKSGCIKFFLSFLKHFEIIISLMTSKIDSKKAKLGVSLTKIDRKKKSETMWSY